MQNEALICALSQLKMNEYTYNIYANKQLVNGGYVYPNFYPLWPVQWPPKASLADHLEMHNQQSPIFLKRCHFNF